MYIFGVMMGLDYYGPRTTMKAQSCLVVTTAVFPRTLMRSIYGVDLLSGCMRVRCPTKYLVHIISHDTYGVLSTSCNTVFVSGSYFRSVNEYNHNFVADDMTRTDCMFPTMVFGVMQISHQGPAINSVYIIMLIENMVLLGKFGGTAGLSSR